MPVANTGCTDGEIVDAGGKEKKGKTGDVLREKTGNCPCRWL